MELPCTLQDISHIWLLPFSLNNNNLCQNVKGLKISDKFEPYPKDNWGILIFLRKENIRFNCTVVI